MSDESGSPFTGNDSGGGPGSTGTDGTVRAQYDWSERAPSTAVVETLAIALDREPTAFGPLYEFVDPDALDEIVQSDAPAARGTGTTVSFTVAGHDVTVHSSGDVVVRPNPRDE